jgi:hypothetical protein
MNEESPKRASVRNEHFKGIDGYGEVHFCLEQTDEPLPEDIYERLAIAYKDLTNSIFDEMIELGQSPSLAEIEGVVNGFLMEALRYIEEQQKLRDKERTDVVLASFYSLADIHLLIREFDGMPELEELF